MQNSDAVTVANFAAKVGELRNFGRGHGLSDQQVSDCMREALLNSSFDEVVTAAKKKFRPPRRRQKCFGPIVGSSVAMIIFFAACCALIAYHKPTQKFISREAQTLIYPFMRTWRIATLPVLTRFPAIMGWHEQQCIIYNPFYRNPDLTCWPCENVRAVADLTFFKDSITSYYLNETPFSIKNLTAEAFTLATLKDMYASNADALDQGTTLFHCSTSSSLRGRTPKDVLDWPSDLTPAVCPDLHINWQFRRVSSAIVLRRTFSRPNFVPNTTEVSLERYIFVDGPTSPQYTLPLTEFANVWLTQVSGERPVVLVPSRHCKSSCTTISTTLSSGNTFFYNWQFWRATFLPSKSGEFAITYMGSSY